MADIICEQPLSVVGVLLCSSENYKFYIRDLFSKQRKTKKFLDLPRGLIVASLTRVGDPHPSPPVPSKTEKPSATAAGHLQNRAEG